MHVVLLELVIDPVCSLVFEAEPSERNAMRKPPRPAREGLFGRRQALLAFVQGLVILAAVLALYLVALRADIAEGEARAMAFMALVFSNLVLAFADSAGADTSFFDRRRVAFWGIVAATVAVLAVVLYVPFAARIFQVQPPEGVAGALTVCVAIVAGGWFGFMRKAGIAVARP